MSTRPTAEVAIAAAAVAAAAVAGYALAGPAAVALVAVASGASSLVLLRFLVPPQPPAGPPGEDLSGPDPAVPQPVLSSFTGSWRRQSRLADAQASQPAYETGLRPQLEHLLASRLAERHGVSLYDDPATARKLFSGGQAGYDSLWTWIDPGRPPVTDQADQPGIPYRALARIIDRLERL
ncbi:MAG: hypothetical protein ACLPKI_03520 [Streptosporangiaceae bacterium]